LAFVNDPLVVIEFDDQKKTRRLIAVMAARVLLCLLRELPSNERRRTRRGEHPRP
jgi:hypothetical protein